VVVAAIHHHVTRRQETGELLDVPVGHVSRRKHQPDDARRLQGFDDVSKRMGMPGALFGQFLGGSLMTVIGHHLVAALNPPAAHVHAHPAELNESDLHYRAPAFKVLRLASRLLIKSSYEAAKSLTPSSSSWRVTWSIEIPALARS